MDDMGKIGCGAFIIVMALIVIGLIFNLMSAAVAPINGAAGVVRSTFNAQQMLANYRYFHEASATIDGMPARLKQAEQAVADAKADNDGYVSSRRTELTGLRAVCVQLVADYNARAGRMDAGFLQNPERYLPVSAAGYSPLPVTYSNELCN